LTEAVPSGFARFRLVLRWVLAVVSIVFVAYAGYKLAVRWESGKVSLSLVPLVLSFVPLVFGTLIQALSWQWLLERLAGKRVPTQVAVPLHLESQLARYTPGKVGVPLVRIAGADRLGAPASAVASSTVLELLPYLSVGGAVGFLFLWIASKHADGALALLGRWGIAGVVVFGTVTLVLTLLDRQRYPSVALKLLGVSGTTPLVPPSMPLSHLVYWSSWALHGYLVCRGVGIPHAAAFGGAGLFVLAPIAGFLALVTPAGMGVREAIVSVGLAPIAGPAPALAAAIVSRGISLVVEVGVWATARVLVRR
jgi:glycosyltransferase 2 family protein